MRTGAKFKHTNFLKRDRFQAKLNAARACRKRGRKTRLVSLLLENTKGFAKAYKFAYRAAFLYPED